MAKTTYHYGKRDLLTLAYLLEHVLATYLYGKRDLLKIAYLLEHVLAGKTLAVGA